MTDETPKKLDVVVVLQAGERGYKLLAAVITPDGNGYKATAADPEVIEALRPVVERVRPRLVEGRDKAQILIVWEAVSRAFRMFAPPDHEVSSQLMVRNDGGLMLIHVWGVSYNPAPWVIEQEALTEWRTA